MHNIWIADDDEAIRMVLEEGLKSSELAITTFANGESLIEALNEDQPDLIISDIKMPGIHGYDLSKPKKSSVRLPKTAQLLSKEGQKSLREIDVTE